MPGRTASALFAVVFALTVACATTAHALSKSLRLAPSGEHAADWYGYGTAGAGDVNNDGYDDVIVGAPLSPGVGARRVFIYFGGPAMSLTPNVVLTAPEAGDNFGLSVDGAGDVNNDGFDDVVVGARLATVSGNSVGRAYVFFGGSPMNTTADVTFTGNDTGGQFGYWVSRAGNVNGDAYDDVIVGAPMAQVVGESRGQARVYFGGAAMDNVPDLTFSGEALNDNFGRSVSEAGDVNNDGFDDMVVGAIYANGRGRAYVYYGGASPNVVADLVLEGQPGDEFGYPVAGAGDVNGDSFDDVLVGSKLWTNEFLAQVGRAQLFFGGAAPNTVADITVVGTESGERMGEGCAGAGDVNADGFADLLIAAPAHNGASEDAGRVLLLLGGTTPDATPDLVIFGDAAFSGLGGSVAAAGDLDGDPYADIVVGAPLHDGAGADAGRAYVYLIHPNALPVAAPWAVALIGLSLSAAGSLAVMRGRARARRKA